MKCALQQALRWVWTDHVFQTAVLIAMPATLAATVLELDVVYETFRAEGDSLQSAGIFVDGQSFGAIFTLLGFLTVFRTAQAYGRYWEACTSLYLIEGDWFDAASSLIAFCSEKPEKRRDVQNFQKLLLRLLSLLNAVILTEVSVETHGDGTGAYTEVMHLPLIDPDSLDDESLMLVASEKCRVEVIFQWIQMLVVRSMQEGVFDVPAPILTRAFQELGAGMLKFHDALKIARIKFPFPYKATTYVLLSLHYLLTPIVMIQVTESSLWSGLLTFFQILILWSLNGIASQLENPLDGNTGDYCSINMDKLQFEQNDRLMSLMNGTARIVPTLKEGAESCPNSQYMTGEDPTDFKSMIRQSMHKTKTRKSQDSKGFIPAISNSSLFTQLSSTTIGEEASTKTRHSGADDARRPSFTGMLSGYVPIAANTSYVEAKALAKESRNSDKRHGSWTTLPESSSDRRHSQSSNNSGRLPKVAFTEQQPCVLTKAGSSLPEVLSPIVSHHTVCSGDTLDVELPPAAPLDVPTEPNPGQQRHRPEPQLVGFAEQSGTEIERLRTLDPVPDRTAVELLHQAHNAKISL